MNVLTHIADNAQTALLVAGVVLAVFGWATAGVALALRRKAHAPR